MSAYYNEIDPAAAEWIRELIRGGHIAPGDVDERDIRDVRPDELRGYTQCHFFAGIGGWSLALHLAGWPDDRPVWTGSCPCQPFSAAGARGGVADERHLWPHWHHLIRERRPPEVFGEQVASKDGLGWLDLVQADLEGTDYACGAADTCSAGFGAPHIRQRQWLGAYDLRPAAGRVQHAPGDGRQERRSEPSGRGPLARRFAGVMGDAECEQRERWRSGEALPEPGALQRAERSGDAGGLEHSLGPRLEGHAGHVHDGDQPGRIAADAGGSVAAPGSAGGLADDDRGQRHRIPEYDRDERYGAQGGRIKRDSQPSRYREACGPMPTNGPWGDADWLLCRDDKWRPVEPGTFPLAHGVPGRVGLLRGYGNAINPWAAKEFIEAYLWARGEILEHETYRPVQLEDIFA